MAKEQLPVAELTIWDDAQKMLVKAREEGIKTAWDRYAAQSPHLEVVKAGKIRGFCAIVGCNNPRMQHDFANVGLAKALIERDILVLGHGVCHHSGW